MRIFVFAPNQCPNNCTSQPMVAISSISNLLLSSRFAAYLLIGGVAVGIDVGLFILLHEVFDFGSIVSHSISVAVSSVYSFVFNAWLNFKKTDKLVFRALSFAAVVFLGYLLGAAIVYCVDAWTPLGASVGKVLSLPFVVVLQFTLNSKISFQD